MNTSIETLLKDHVEPWRVALPLAPAADYPPTAVLSENLYEGLKAVRLGGKLPNLPILSCVHIYTRDGCIWLETTDFTNPLRAEVAARVSQEFDACVPWRPFTDWVQIAAHDHDCLELIWDPAVCILTARAKFARYHAEFKGMDSAEFPPITEEQLARERAPKRLTFSALCKETAKAWHMTSLERLDGSMTPLLSAMRDPRNRPGDLMYWTREEFPVPALVLHHRDGEGKESPEVAIWKLGTAPVALGPDQESETLWSRDVGIRESWLDWPTLEQCRGQRFILPAPETEAE